MDLFTQQQLNSLKQLARLECSPEEDQALLSSLTELVHYLDQLQEVDTSEVPPTRYVLRTMLKNPVRPDRVEDLLPRETFLQNAPDQIGGMIRVHPILKTP